MINMELDYARKMFYPIKHLIEWDTFEVCSGDDATRTMSNLIKNWKANGIPNDLSSCAACPRGQGDVTAAFVRLLDLADNIDVVLLCDIEHIGNLREAGCVIFDTQFSHLLYGDGYPKLGSGNVALLGEERTSKLAARFGFMELLGRREKVMSKMKGIIPDPKTINELMQIEMEMRPLAKQERKSLLGAVTRELGYSGDDGAVVTDTLEGIFDSTSGGGLAGLGDLMDGAAEGAMDGAEVGTPEIKVETHVIGL